jgi:apolipoprotein N-acyltransferase
MGASRSATSEQQSLAATDAVTRAPVFLQSRRVRGLAAFVAGAGLSAAFAPIGLWPLAILCPAVLMWLWQGAKPREAAWYGFWFNTGTFAAGTYWLYISIHVFGEAPLWIAFGLMAALVGIMALYHALLGYAAARWFPQNGPLRWLLALPAGWVLIEWWRGWFLSGFAWLSLGYSQTDTWLAQLAPVVGIYGVSAALLFSAGAVVTLLLGDRRARIVAAAVLVTPWLAGALLQNVEWTSASGEPKPIAILQGAISQDMKWLANNREATLKLYSDLNQQALGAAVIVWPEAAPPDLANNLIDYLRGIYRDSRAKGSGVVLGVARADDTGENYYNSVLGLGETVQWYDKHHLVPFGEFFPVPSFVRSWLRLMSLPYGDFARGATYQPPLQVGGLKLSPTICYEDAYGSTQLRSLQTADVLVNVTNDAWFGRSTARHQHLQISRMRAIEAGRYMLRAANDGISAVIGPRGEIVARAPEFQPYVLKATITPRIGLPPYAHVGNWLVVCVAALTLALSILSARLSRKREAPATAGSAAPQVR